MERYGRPATLWNILSASRPGAGYRSLNSVLNRSCSPPRRYLGTVLIGVSCLLKRGS